jgi:Relaxase/Mobilisation nuclease domain
MIAKGNTHKNGDKLARYLTQGKDGERAELWELSGFAPGDIRDAFRSVHVITEATHCEQPFFHVQVRNPENEELTRAQWLLVANRIEAKLGLTNQPRAIAFHIDETTGHEHMHVAWSRINSETMRAVPLPYFKQRLKEVCRELEKTLDLTRVKNERDDHVKAPTRNEFEQARRLGVDIQEVRQNIRDCFERSDNARSFEAALADHGLVLAQGDRRAYVVIDHEGGIHALGKRVLGLTAGQTRDRMADLDRDELPTVEKARSFIREQQVSREKTGSVVMRDPHRDDMAWQDALTKAGIEKEKIERRFVNPGERLELERQLFRDLGKIGILNRESPVPPPKELSFIERHIWKDYHANSNSPHAFVAALADHKIALATVTKEEADRSHREAEFAKAVGNFAPRYREGEIVAMTEPGPTFRREGEPVELRRIYRLNARTTGDDRDKIEQFLEPVRNKLWGIDATKEMLNARGADRAAYWEAFRLENSQRIANDAPAGGKRINITPAIGAAERTAGQALKVLDVVSNSLEAVLAPVLTPEQRRAGAQTERERAADAAEKIDLSQYLADLAQRRQRHETEQQATRQRQRDDMER